MPTAHNSTAKIGSRSREVHAIYRARPSPTPSSAFKREAALCSQQPTGRPGRQQKGSSSPTHGSAQQTQVQSWRRAASPSWYARRPVPACSAFCPQSMDCPLLLLTSPHVSPPQLGLAAGVGIGVCAAQNYNVRTAVASKQSFILYARVCGRTDAQRPILCPS